MSGCGCESNATQMTSNDGRRKTLRMVLVINAVMFVGVLLAGLWADSQALIADSADNLGDALVYALSLLVANRSMQWRAGAAMVKGVIQLMFGLVVVGSIVNSLLGSPEPLGAAIMGVAAVALIANLVCFVLLIKHRDEDINMKSVWLCSRNDVLANAGVIVAGLLVLWLDAFWPDIAVATLIAGVFLHTAWVVLSDSVGVWRHEAALSNS